MFHTTIDIIPRKKCKYTPFVPIRIQTIRLSEKNTDSGVLSYHRSGSDDEKRLHHMKLKSVT